MKSYQFTLCLFLSASAIGQRHSLSINYTPSLTYFGKQSQRFQHYYFASRKGAQTFKSSINILYNYKISSKLSVRTGLEYCEQGQNINFNADSAFPGNTRKILKIELNYLRFSGAVSYLILKTTRLELGLYSGISIGTSIKRKDNYQDIILENILLPPAEKRYKHKDWAIPIGINYKKELTRKVFADFGIEYLIGLTNAFSENRASKFGVLSEFNNSKQMRLALEIGIGLNLSK